jgi:hypothetical protein
MAIKCLSDENVLPSLRHNRMKGAMTLSQPCFDKHASLL